MDERELAQLAAPACCLLYDDNQKVARKGGAR
jgi:hypothetical protein